MDVNQSLLRAQTWSRVGGTPLWVLWERCSEPISDKSRPYHLGRPQKHDFGLIWASRGLRRPNQTDNSTNKSCIGQIGAIWKCVLVFGGAEGPSNGYKIQKQFKNSKKNVFLLFFSIESPSPQARGTYYEADEGCGGAVVSQIVIKYGHITWDVPKNTISGSFGPLWASKGL